MAVDRDGVKQQEDRRLKLQRRPKVVCLLLIVIGFPIGYPFGGIAGGVLGAMKRIVEDVLEE